MIVLFGILSINSMGKEVIINDKSSIDAHCKRMAGFVQFPHLSAIHMIIALIASLVS